MVRRRCCSSLEDIIAKHNAILNRYENNHSILLERKDRNNQRIDREAHLQAKKDFQNLKIYDRRIEEMEEERRIVEEA